MDWEWSLSLKSSCCGAWKAQISYMQKYQSNTTHLALPYFCYPFSPHQERDCCGTGMLPCCCPAHSHKFRRATSRYEQGHFVFTDPSPIPTERSSRPLVGTWTHGRLYFFKLLQDFAQPASSFSMLDTPHTQVEHLLYEEEVTESYNGSGQKRPLKSIKSNPPAKSNSQPRSVLWRTCSITSNLLCKWCIPLILIYFVNYPKSQYASVWYLLSLVTKHGHCHPSLA